MNKNEIIKIVKELSEKKGSSILKKEFPYPVSFYLKYFKTWSEVLEEAGLKKNVLKNLTKEDLVNYIIKYKKEFGKTPRHEDFINLKGYPSASRITQEFETWINALKESGLIKKSKKFNIDNNLILELLEQFEEEYKRLKELNNNKNISKKFYNKNRSNLSPCSAYLEKITNRNWNQILKDLNIEVIHEPSKTFDSKEEIINNYIIYSEEIKSKNGATIEELKESKININAVRLRFGGINGLRIASGYSIKTTNYKKFSQEEIIKILKGKYLKYERRLTAEEIMNDKDLPGLTTICSYFFTTKLSEVWEEVEKKLNEGKHI